MVSQDARHLTKGRRQDSGKFLLSAAISQLLRQKKLGAAEAVANLCEHPGPISPRDIEEVARWLRQVGKDWATE